MSDTALSFGNQAPMKIQCAECHWMGLASELIGAPFPSEESTVLCCPVCLTKFSKYPQRIEHLWSDPY